MTIQVKMKKGISKLGLIASGMLIGSLMMFSSAAQGVTITESTMTVAPIGNPSTTTASVKTIDLNAAGSDTSFTVDWFFQEGANGNLESFDIVGKGTWTIDSFDLVSKTVTFSIKIENLTVPDAGQNAGFTSFGFGVDPDAIATADFNDLDATDTDAFGDLGQDTNFPAFQSIDVCLFTNNNCAGSSQGSALAAGQYDDHIMITLDFSSNLAFNGTFDLLMFPLKVQAENSSYELAGDVPFYAPVPEAETMLLFLSGIGLLGLFLRSRQ